MKSAESERDPKELRRDADAGTSERCRIAMSLPLDTAAELEARELSRVKGRSGGRVTPVGGHGSVRRVMLTCSALRESTRL